MNATERKEHAAKIREQIDAAIEVAERLHAVIQHGYKSAVLISDPSQIVLMQAMANVSTIRAPLADLAAILEGQS